MKAFALAILGLVVFAVGAAAVLNSEQTLAYKAFATSSTRVSDPGYNLVGKNWSGDPAVKETH
ncbi:MAG: hypothetical protein JOZ84_03910 [Methylobacteriaceae bacterium]|jgi:hypothetical protein|nr:hypothetical protein [Methylobacteriaceae bacterium]MBV9393537.1 hypothetical protein [Methylobacteriaceae bacterium]